MLRRLLPLFVKHASLPLGYRRVAGLTMNDNCYWQITDFRLYGSDTVKFSFSAITACNVLGCYTNTTAQTNYSLYVGTSGAKYMRYNGGTYDSTIVPDTRYDMVMGPTGATGLPTSSTWTEKEFTTASDFCIGTTSLGATSAKLKGTLYGNIEIVGRAKFIPCERQSDHVLGYYEKYTHTFYAPTSGTPTEYTV